VLSETRLLYVRGVPAALPSTALSFLAVMATRMCTAAAVLCVLVATLTTAVLAARKHSPLLEDNALPKKGYRVTGTISVDRYSFACNNILNIMIWHINKCEDLIYYITHDDNNIFKIKIILIFIIFRYTVVVLRALRMERISGIRTFSFPPFTFTRHALLPVDKRAGRCFRKPIFGIFTNMRLPRRPWGYRNLFVLILFLAFIITMSISMFTIGVPIMRTILLLSLYSYIRELHNIIYLYIIYCTVV